MLARSLQTPVAALGCALALAACQGVKVTHVPRGQSVEIALARRPDVVRLPPSAPARTAAAHGGESGPVVPDKTEQLAEAFSRGQFSMQTGNEEAAIQAFREAVKIDPKFKDAWANLAALYERAGQEKLALEAFRKSKSVQ